MHRYSQINFILVFGFFGGISALLDNAVEKTRDPGDGGCLCMQCRQYHILECVKKNQ